MDGPRINPKALSLFVAGTMIVFALVVAAFATGVADQPETVRAPVVASSR